MKKIISILLSCLFLFSQMIVVFAEISDAYESDTIEYVTLPIIPETASFRHASATFFLSDGVAYVTYSVTADGKNIDVSILIEKKTMGIFWANIGKAEYNSGSKSYMTGDYSVKADGNGEYRATVLFRRGSEKIRKVIYFSYDDKKLIGDVDGNGVIRSADARLALRFSAKIQKYTQAQLERADVNCDGRMTASDARVILRFSGGFV